MQELQNNDDFFVLTFCKRLDNLLQTQKLHAPHPPP